MGIATDFLELLKAWASPAAPGLDQPITPGIPNRTNFVVAEAQLVNTIAIASTPSISVEISPDGQAWEQVDHSEFNVGTVRLVLLGIRILDLLGTGNRKLIFYVPAGYQYRFVGATGIGAGNTLSIQRAQEWGLEVDDHRTVLWRVGPDQKLHPTSSHIHLCDAPCFTPQLFIDEYKRDPSESYRSFTAGDPPKGYVRAAVGGGGGGTGEDDLAFINADIETGDETGWGGDGTQGIGVTTDQNHTPGGTWSFGGNGQLNINYPKNRFQDHDLTAYATDIDAGNVTATFPAWLYIDDVAETATIRIEYLNASKDTILRTDELAGISVPGDLPAATWTQMQLLSATLPSGARHARCYVVWDNINGGVIQTWWDDIGPLTVTFPSGPPVTGNLLVRGRFDENDPASFNLNWRGVDYAFTDIELTDLGNGEWEFQGDPGAEVGPPGELLTISQTGQPDQQVEICVDRTAPTADLSLSGMAFGDSGGNPMLRGEYAALVATYGDGGGVGIESAAISHQSPSYWTAEPTSAPASGLATPYFRSSASAPLSGSTGATLTVTDLAGNQAQDTVEMFFGALPASSAVALTDLTGAQRPAHLNNVEYGETAYDDNTIGATVNIAPAVAACRNSGNDDTKSQLRSGTLSVNTSEHNEIAGDAQRVHGTNVPSQGSKLNGTVIGRVVDQHYRAFDSAAAGDFAFNASRSDDFGLDQSVGSGAPPFNGRSIEPFTDEFAGDNLVNAIIFDGTLAIQALAGEAEVAFAIPNNDSDGFRPRLFDPQGNELLHSAYGGDLQVKIFDGVSFVDPAPGIDDFGPNALFEVAPLDGAQAMTIKVIDTSGAAPAIGAAVVNYKAA